MIIPTWHWLFVSKITPHLLPLAGIIQLCAIITDFITSYAAICALNEHVYRTYVINDACYSGRQSLYNLFNSIFLPAIYWKSWHNIDIGPNATTNTGMTVDDVSMDILTTLSQCYGDRMTSSKAFPACIETRKQNKNSQSAYRPWCRSIPVPECAGVEWKQTARK